MLALGELLDAEDDPVPTDAPGVEDVGGIDADVGVDVGVEDEVDAGNEPTVLVSDGAREALASVMRMVCHSRLQYVRIH